MAELWPGGRMTLPSRTAAAVAVGSGGDGASRLAQGAPRGVESKRGAMAPPFRWACDRIADFLAQRQKQLGDDRVAADLHCHVARKRRPQRRVDGGARVYSRAIQADDPVVGV